MNGFAKAGLITLMAAIPAVIGQEFVSRPYIPKQGIESRIDDNSYIGPDGNYSLKKDPKIYGFMSPRHNITGNGFKDVYVFLPAQLPGSLIIEGMKMDGDLQKVYDAYYQNYVKVLSSSLFQKLKPGQTLNSIVAPTEYIYLDGNPALSGGIELTVTGTPGNGNVPHYILLTTLAKGKGSFYGIVLFNQGFGNPKGNANALYIDVMKGFHALK